MAARDLAIGLLLGGGGGQKEDLMFDELLQKSTQVSTVPINNKFHYTVNAIQSIPFDFGLEQYGDLPQIKYTNILFFDQFYSRGGTQDGYDTGDMYEWTTWAPKLYLFAIAYENNNPIYAVKLNMGDSSTMPLTTEKGDIETQDRDAWICFPLQFSVFDQDSVESDAGLNLAVYNSSFSDTGRYGHFFTQTDTQYNYPLSQIFQVDKYTVNNTINYQTISGYNYAYAVPTITQTREKVNIFGSDFSFPVLSHLPFEQVKQKYYEITNDINTDPNMYNLNSYHVGKWGKVISS